MTANHQVAWSSVAKGPSLTLASALQDRPLGPPDLLATMYRFLGISADISPTDFSGRPIPLFPSGEMFG